MKKDSLRPQQNSGFQQIMAMNEHLHQRRREPFALQWCRKIAFFRGLSLFVLCGLLSFGLNLQLKARNSEDYDFPAGYQFRIELNEKETRARFILQYPDGRKELIWEPPAKRYLNNGLKSVLFGVIGYGRIVDQTLCLAVTGDGGWWWIRWDMEKKQRYPVVEFPGQHLGMGEWEMIGRASVKVEVPPRYKSEILTVDDKGVLYKDGKPWRDSGYFVFGENWSKMYLQPELGGGIVYDDAPKGFPFDDYPGMGSGAYLVNADGTRRPWPRGPTLPDPTDAKRVGGINRNTSLPAPADSDIPKAAIGSVNGTDEPTTLQKSWATWMWVGITSLLAAVFGWLFFRSKGSKS